jgi:hypothetical protein
LGAQTSVESPPRENKGHTKVLPIAGQDLKMIVAGLQHNRLPRPAY